MSVTKRRRQKTRRAENVRRYLCAQGLIVCAMKAAGVDCGHRSDYNQRGSAAATLLAGLTLALTLAAAAWLAVAHLALLTVGG